MKKTALLIAAGGLALSVALAPAPLAQAAAPTGTSATTSASSTPSAKTASSAKTAPTAARRQALGTYKCKPFKSPSVVGKTCARLSVLNEKFKVDYQRTFQNKFKKRKEFTCSTSKQTTWEFGASVTGEVEAGVIFSKVKLSATASVSRSYTTQDTASATFTLGPKKFGHCERGTYVYDFKGQVKRVRCNASGCRNSVTKFKGTAPSRDFFAIGPGRG